jgi:gliding motility-associated-like protein
MKRMVTFLVAAWMLSSLQLASFAQTVNFSINPATAMINQGDQICVGIQVSNFTNIVSKQYSINYAGSVLQFNNAQGFNLPGMNASNIGNPSSGNITVSWLADDILNGASVANGTTIYQLCFTAIVSSGTSPINFSGMPSIIEITNPSGEVQMGSTGGTVTVGSGGPPPTSDLTFTASQETASPGNIVCVDVTVQNFTSIVSMQYSINYNASILSFNNAQGFGLGGMNTSNFGNPSAGNITVSWLADDIINGATVPNGTVIFQLCFTAQGGGTSPINFSGTPSIIEVTNPMGEVTPVFQNGSVVVSGSPPPPTGLTFTASNETAAPGSTVCVDISVANFTNVVSMQFSMNYNASQLSFNNAQGFNLPSFNASNVGNPSAGNITLSWLSDDILNGTTVPNGTVILQLCFTVTGNSGTTPINFSGIPSIVEVTTPSGEVTPSFQSGSVTISGDPVGPLPFSVNAQNVTGLSGSTICVPITVTGFNGIVSMQFSMNYNGAHLSFQNAQGFNLSGLNASSFGNPSSGNISFSWLADDIVNGATVPNGTAIFELCFTALAPNCTETPVSFSGSPVIIEVTDSQGDVNFNSTPGTVNVCNLIPLVLIASQETVAPGGNTCVNISAQEFTNIVSFQFSVNYTASIVSYTGAQGFGLPGMNASNFGNPSAGNITISWLADDIVNGVTVSPGTVLFQLCFDAVGNPDQVSPINITGMPTLIEVTNSSSQTVPVTIMQGSITISEVSCPPIAIQETIDSSCFGSSDGSISLSLSGGDDSYTFSWDFNNGTSSTLDNVPAGIYTVAITSCGQTVVESYTVPELPAISIEEAIVSDIACFGESTGSIFLSVEGTSPLSYQWIGSGVIQNPTQQFISGLGTGIYWATITDGNGCELVSSEYVITQPASALNVTVSSVTPVSCHGGNDGGIAINAAGGTPGYSFSWAHTPVNTNVLDNLSAGSYQVTVTDSRGCEVEQAGIEVVEPTPINITIVSITNETIAGNDGSIFINVSGGNGGYTYLWNGPGGPYSTEDLSGLTAGTYNLTVTDVNGCTQTLSATIIKPLTVTLVSTNNSCFNQSTGSIFIATSGGTEPYSFEWSGPGGPFFVESLTNITGGTYELTVTDAEGTQVSISVTITEPAQPFQVSGANVINPSMFQTCNGTININALSGGIQPYTYAWSNGMSGAIISNLCDGTYTVTVTDANGCTTQATYTIAFVPPPLVPVTNTPVHVDCAGATNGSWTVSVLGGLPPYNFMYSDAFSQPSLNGTVTRTGLPAGTYTVTVTDGFTPPQQMVFTTTINEPNPIQLVSLTILPETAAGSNGQLQLELTGGTLPYTFQWTNAFTGQNPFNLQNGCYSVTIIDKNDCLLVAGPFCVPRFQVTNVAKVDAACSGVPTGSINLTMAGVINEPLQYTWIGPGGVVLPFNGPAADGLSAGIYTFFVTDALGVSTPPQQIQVNNISNVSISAAPTTDYNGFNVSCHGETDGAAFAVAQSGQTPYNYTWCQGLGTGQNVSGLGAGSYCVVVVDAVGCTDSTTIQLNQPLPLIVTPTIRDISCRDDNNGSISLKISGGNPAYQIAWQASIGQQTNPIVQLGAGVYSVTVSDENGCTALGSYTVSESEPMELSFIVIDDTGAADGSIAAIVSGGSAPYTYQWSNSQTGSVIGQLRAGEYVVMVTDANGCTVFGNVFLSDNSVPCLDYRNIISPNGDGMNDEFIINCLSLYPGNRLEIFNRWGQTVFEVHNYQNNWIGTTQGGDPLPEGAYFFVFEYTDFEGRPQQLKGHITLLR